jgi:hypothetical protein
VIGAAVVAGLVIALWSLAQEARTPITRWIPIGALVAVSIGVVLGGLTVRGIKAQILGREPDKPLMTTSGSVYRRRSLLVRIWLDWAGWRHLVRAASGYHHGKRHRAWDSRWLSVLLSLGSTLAREVRRGRRPLQLQRLDGDLCDATGLLGSDDAPRRLAVASSLARTAGKCT